MLIPVACVIPSVPPDCTVNVPEFVLGIVVVAAANCNVEVLFTVMLLAPE